jgi:hypothetical protein
MRPYVTEFGSCRKTMHVVVGPAVDIDDLRGRPLDADVLRKRPTGSSTRSVVLRA